MTAGPWWVQARVDVTSIPGVNPATPPIIPFEWVFPECADLADAKSQLVEKILRDTELPPEAIDEAQLDGVPLT